MLKSLVGFFSLNKPFIKITSNITAPYEAFPYEAYSTRDRILKTASATWLDGRTYISFLWDSVPTRENEAWSLGTQVNQNHVMFLFKTDSIQSLSNKCKNYLLKIYSQYIFEYYLKLVTVVHFSR